MNELFEELRHPVVYMNFPAKRFAEIAFVRSRTKQIAEMPAYRDYFSDNLKALGGCGSSIRST